MTVTSYICDHCRKSFETERPEADALAEMERDFPGFVKADCGVVCDDCYREFLKWQREQPATGGVYEPGEYVFSEASPELTVPVGIFSAKPKPRCWAQSAGMRCNLANGHAGGHEWVDYE